MKGVGAQAAARRRSATPPRRNSRAKRKVSTKISYDATKFTNTPDLGQCTEMVAPGITGRTRPTKVKKQISQQKRKRDDVDVEKLEQAVNDLVGTPNNLKSHAIH